MGSKPPADERPLTGDVTGHVSARERRGFQKPTRGFLVRQERLDFVPERVIAGAQLGQNASPARTPVAPRRRCRCARPAASVQASNRSERCLSYSGALTAD